VQHATRARNLPSRDRVRRWARAALARDAELTVRIVGEGEARALNRRFRGRNYATNVLTFVLRERPPYAGDLVLCAPVVAREARAQGKSLAAHYAHLIVHGALHLQGYDHENEADAETMETRESRILRDLGYPDPYGRRKRRERGAEKAVKREPPRSRAPRPTLPASRDHGRSPR
jgi:probable rRNA maturation factor